MQFRFSTPEIAGHVNNLLSLAEFANRIDRGCWSMQTRDHDTPQVYGPVIQAISGIVFQELLDRKIGASMARTVTERVMDRCSAVAPVESVGHLCELVNEVLDCWGIDA